MLKTFRFSDKTFLFLFLAVCFLTYGIFIPWLGFYWDDWPVILMGKFFGVKAYSNFYIYDRPFSAWTYIVSLPLLGLRPLTWQIFTLLVRLSTGLFFWLTLRRLWPQQRIQTAWMIIIFLVHPVFTLQFISVAFSQHWITALLYSFSLWAMLNSFATSRKRWVWWILALGSSALHLFTMEYFLGMEGFRYVVIWLTPGPYDSIRQRWSGFIRRAAPYILVLAFFIFWRFFIFKFPQEDPNPIRFLQDLRSQPLTGLLTLAQIVLRDLLYMLVQVWALVLDSARMVLSSKFFWFSVLFAGVIAVALALSFSRFASDQPESTLPPSSWTRQAIWVGLLAVLLGALPGWITYRQVLTQPYGNRIALPSLLGLGILTVALIEWLTQDKTRRNILLSILCGIAIYSQVYVANNYREAWNAQESLYWQLHWRMPALQPGTSLLSDSEIVLGAGEYSTVSAINLLYAKEFDIQKFPYWFFNMTQRFRSYHIQRLQSDKGLSVTFRSWHFEGDDNAVLLVQNSLDGCMQILSEDQPQVSQLSPLLTQALPHANLDRIISNPGADSLPPAEIFGREPAHTWCYYYQKASLAHQSGDWAKVVDLLKEADRRGYEPANKSEWLLFADAYMRMGNLSAARELTSRIQSRDPRLTPLLCTYWSGQAALPADSRDSILQTLECNKE